MGLGVREALESDWPAIAEVILAAFGREEGPEIAGLAAELLQDPTAHPSLALVATANGRAVGYLLFTSTRIKDAQQAAPSAILAPLAVHPDYQGQGLGGRLIEEGLGQLRASGVDLVFVLGHPGYYSKFGFSPAGARGFEAPYRIPPENADAWMVQELRPGAMGRISGQVVCADALNAPEHWQE
ncbi:GNAT family N-acetyltransferase [Thiohalorhabdus methylotrophus]|uniref:GNAT family N-acetyltransferase n=1 Tax=Thiohalorhabdus methylotrophus TaxID=3242694 RepID=A0ABV4U117_9GAMM